jgi:hypothetical protein
MNSELSSDRRRGGKLKDMIEQKKLKTLAEEKAK